MAIKHESLERLRMIRHVLDLSNVPMNSDEISERIRREFQVTIFPSSIASLITSNFSKPELFRVFKKQKLVVEIINVGKNVYYQRRVYFWTNSIPWNELKRFRNDLLIRAREDPRRWKKPARQLELFTESDLRKCSSYSSRLSSEA